MRHVLGADVTQITRLSVVLSDAVYVCPQVKAAVLNAALAPGLTAGGVSLIQLLAQGLTNRRFTRKAMARALNVQNNTLGVRIHQLRGKLGVYDEEDIVNWRAAGMCLSSGVHAYIAVRKSLYVSAGVPPDESLAHGAGVTRIMLSPWLTVFSSRPLSMRRMPKCRVIKRARSGEAKFCVSVPMRHRCCAS